MNDSKEILDMASEIKSTSDESLKTSDGIDRLNEQFPKLMEKMDETMKNITGYKVTFEQISAKKVLEAVNIFNSKVTTAIDASIEANAVKIRKLKYDNEGIWISPMCIKIVAITIAACEILPWGIYMMNAPWKVSHQLKVEKERADSLQNVCNWWGNIIKIQNMKK
jgi:hypothetical protein